MVERDPTHGIELKETHAQRVPQQRRRIHFGESELRETNPCVSVLVCLTTCHSSFTLCFHEIYLVVLFLCVQVLEIYLTTSTEALHQVTFVLELKEGRTLIFEQVLHRTGLTSHRLPVVHSGYVLDRSDRSVC